MNWIGLAAAITLSCVTGPAAAQLRPQPGPGDPRLQTVDYTPDQVVVLEAAPGYQLTLELSPDEQIENVAVGDSGAWQVTANRRGDRLFIKPLQAGAATNMTVITNTRIYAMDLVSLYEPTATMAYTVRFNYPEPANESGEPAVGGGDEAPSQAVDEGLYRLAGDRQIRPSAISDDGTRTYVEWPRDRALPAVYGVDASGTEMLVNGMMQDDILVIHDVFPRLVFRQDRRVARAVRLVAPGAE